MSWPPLWLVKSDQDFPGRFTSD